MQHEGSVLHPVLQEYCGSGFTHQAYCGSAQRHCGSGFTQRPGYIFTENGFSCILTAGSKRKTAFNVFRSKVMKANVTYSATAGHHFSAAHKHAIITSFTRVLPCQTGSLKDVGMEEMLQTRPPFLSLVHFLTKRLCANIWKAASDMEGNSFSFWFG